MTQDHKRFRCSRNHIWPKVRRFSLAEPNESIKVEYGIGVSDERLTSDVATLAMYKYNMHAGMKHCSPRPVEVDLL